jgi:hypothetical protein
LAMNMKIPHRNHLYRQDRSATICTGRIVLAEPFNMEFVSILDTAVLIQVFFYISQAPNKFKSITHCPYFKQYYGKFLAYFPFKGKCGL